MLGLFLLFARSPSSEGGRHGIPLPQKHASTICGGTTSPLILQPFSSACAWIAWLARWRLGLLAGWESWIACKVHSAQASAQTNAQTKFSRTSADLLKARRGGANQCANQMARVDS